MSLSAEECNQAAFAVESNSELQFNNAIKLAEINSYGMACSSLILSIEERVKAFVLILEANGFRFRFECPHLKRIFYDHRTRYYFAFLFIVFSSAFEEFKSVFLLVIQDPNKARKYLALEHKPRVLRRVMKIRLVPWINSLASELNWFAQADQFRQKGMYVDYNSELQHPKDISSNEYKSLYLRCKAINSFLDIDKLNQGFSDQNSEDHLHKFLVKFNKEKYYARINEMIPQIKSKKNNLFDKTGDILMEFMDGLTQSD